MKRKIIAIVMALLTVLAVVAVDRAGASSWSWAASEPVLHASEEVLMSHDYCPTFRQQIDVWGYGQRHACMFMGSAMRIGTTTGRGNEMIAAASLRNETQYVPLDGVCSAQPDCVYIAETDTLLERQYMTNMYLTLKVYDHASERLRFEYDVGRMMMVYRFDRSNPSYELRADGSDMAAGSFTVSDNGRWLVVELIGRGLALVDLRSGEARRIVAPGYPYGMGLDPRIELAVTNDGRTVVQTGYNAGFSMYNITPECGESLRVPLPHTFQLTANACPNLSLDINHYVNGFLTGHYPKFDQVGGQLTTLVREGGGAVKRLTLWAAGYQGSPGLGYLALGDSFTSGEGETTDQRYLPGTNTIHEKCHLSDRSYPFLVAGTLDALQLGMKSVACAGARSVDIVGGSPYWGQGDRLGASGLGLDETGKDQAQQEARGALLPGRVRQSEFVAEHQPRIATVGIGGNDAGLMAKLKDCAMPGTCEWAADETGILKTADEIRSLYEPLIAMYLSLGSESPKTQFYSIGYPLVILPEGQCGVVTGFLLDRKEREFMDQGVRYLNQVVRAASQAAGVIYLDVEDSLSGHQLCSGDHNTAMNGLRIGDDISPLQSLPMLKLIGGETFHPTPYGHELMAARLLEQFPGQTLPLPEYLQAPSTPTAWQQTSMYREPLRAVSTDLTQEVIAPNARQITVDLPASSLQPGTTVTIKVGTQLLQTQNANEHGGLKATVDIPPELQDGFYALHAVGLTLSGQMVDMYQVVTLGVVPDGPTPNDPSADTVTEDTSATVSRSSLPAAVGAALVRTLISTIGMNPILATPTQPIHADAAVLGTTTERQSVHEDPVPWLRLVGIGLIVCGIGGVVWLVIFRRRR